MNEIIVASSDGVPIVTVIQVLAVEEGNEDRAVERVVGEMQGVAGPVDSLASSRVEITADRAHVVHCAQWRSRSALEVTLGVPSARARMAAIQRIADDDPHLCEWATFDLA